MAEGVTGEQTYVLTARESVWLKIQPLAAHAASVAGVVTGANDLLGGQIWHT